jgi:hypothetical protein
MYQIVSTKTTGENTEVVYRLENSLSQTLLEKFESMGLARSVRSERFDRRDNPLFRIKNPEMGVELMGRIGDDFLYCILTANQEKGKALIEETLRRVA